MKCSKQEAPGHRLWSEKGSPDCQHLHPHLRQPPLIMVPAGLCRNLKLTQVNYTSVKLEKTHVETQRAYSDQHNFL